MLNNDFINKLNKKGITPGLDAMNILLDSLGHPEEDLSVVHIAGTNGKGSILAFLAAILKEAHFRVGRYVSPAVRCYEEHFQINDTYIDEERLAGYYNRIEETVCHLEREGKETPSLFEVETAIAFLYFRDEKVDYALIETGMGGLLDATNVVKHPVLTIISSISYDHMAYLGDTLTDIARQKAGIIKSGTPVIVSENPPDVISVIREYARTSGSPFYAVRPEDYRILEEDYKGSTFLYEGEEFEIQLPGTHQAANAVTALKAASVLRRERDRREQKGKDPGTDEVWNNALHSGLLRASWPGRLQILGRNPLIYLDGAHNPDGAGRLADFLRKHFTNHRILYIMGVLKDKEYVKMLAYLMPLAADVFIFRPDNSRGLDTATLAESIRSFGKSAVICEDVNEAIRLALMQADMDDVLMICGSLSFMADISRESLIRRD